MNYIYDLNPLDSLRQNNPLPDLFLSYDSIAWGALSFLILFSLSMPTIVALRRGHSTVLFIFIVSIALLPLQFPSKIGSVQLSALSQAFLLFLLNMWSFFGPKKKKDNLVLLEEKSIGLKMKLVMIFLCFLLHEYAGHLTGTNYHKQFIHFPDSHFHHSYYTLNWARIYFVRDYFSYYIFMWGIILAGFFWIGLLFKPIFSRKKRHPLTILFLQTYVIFLLFLLFIIIDIEFLYFFIELGYIGKFIFIFLPFAFSWPTILASLRKHPYLSRILLLNISCFLLLLPGIFEGIIGGVGSFYFLGIFMALPFWLALLLWAFSETGRRLENSERLV